MKSIGILKEKYDKAETTADKKKVLAEAGILLTDVELEGVAFFVYILSYQLWYYDYIKQPA